VQDLTRQLRTVAGAFGDAPLLYVSEHVSLPLRREPDEANINCLDTTGWVSLTASDRRC
jgi:hypothetical protein